MELTAWITGAIVAAVAGGLWLWQRQRAQRRALLAGTPLLIGEAMAKRGVSPADAEAAGLEGELQAAVERCGACGQTEACREWLAEGDGAQSPGYCANRRVLDEVAAAKAAARSERPPSVLVVKP